MAVIVKRTMCCPVEAELEGMVSLTHKPLLPRPSGLPIANMFPSWAPAVWSGLPVPPFWLPNPAEVSAKYVDAYVVAVAATVDLNRSQSAVTLLGQPAAFALEMKSACSA